MESYEFTTQDGMDEYRVEWVLEKTESTERLVFPEFCPKLYFCFQQIYFCLRTGYYDEARNIALSSRASNQFAPLV